VSDIVLIAFRQDVPPGKWVRALGSDIEAGATVLAAGERVGAAEIGILATVGAAHVQVAALNKLNSNPDANPNPGHKPDPEPTPEPDRPVPCAQPA